MNVASNMYVYEKIITTPLLQYICNVTVIMKNILNPTSSVASLSWGVPWTMVKPLALLRVPAAEKLGKHSC